MSDIEARSTPKPHTYPEEYDTVPKLRELDLPAPDCYLIGSTVLELCELRDLVASLRKELAEARNKALDDAIDAAGNAQITIPFTPGAADGACVAVGQVIDAIRSLKHPISSLPQFTEREDNDES